MDACAKVKRNFKEKRHWLLPPWVPTHEGRAIATKREHWEEKMGR